MATIESLMLRTANVQSQRQFYCDILGMQEFIDGSVGYGAEQARIHFLPAQGDYQPQSNDLFWKIALAVPDIELAHRQLTSQGIQVGMPRQFQDIGYLAHFTDPEGFTVELIEHWFEGNRPNIPINSSLLGGGAHFNLITLRTVNINTVIDFCTSCRMTLLSIQSVENYGFSLYFFAFTADVPPSSDLRSVANREWLYQRRYTLLEIQHVQNNSYIIPSSDAHPGYAGTVFSDLSCELERNAMLVRANEYSKDSR